MTKASCDQLLEVLWASLSEEVVVMIIKYSAEINDDAIVVNLQRLTNQIYKLLPSREEGVDWVKPLETILVEVAGMDRLLIEQHSILFPLLCKLEGLFVLTDEDDFPLYRRNIFECLSLIGELVSVCQVQKI